MIFSRIQGCTTVQQTSSSRRSGANSGSTCRTTRHRRWWAAGWAPTVTVSMWHFCGIGCGKRWTGSRRKRGSILTRRIPHPPSAVRCGIGRAIPRCRIWMQGGTRKWTCSPARWCAWGVNWGSRRRTMSLPII